MDVTFVLEDSGATATVEVPCDANAAAAKEIACMALAVPPASVEMRIGAQVLEGTCRLQDTAFVAGVQVVLACRFADIKCPAEYTAPMCVSGLTLSRCGTLCVYNTGSGHVGSFDTETFDTVFSFKVDAGVEAAPAISQCGTRCYLACGGFFLEVALPGGEVIRKVDGTSKSVCACGGVVASRRNDGVSVYDEDLTLLRSFSHEKCAEVSVSHDGGWVISSSWDENVRLCDVNTGVAVACVPAQGWLNVTLSRPASVFAVEEDSRVKLYDWSGAALFSVDVAGDIKDMQFTPCGKYLIVTMDVAEIIDADNYVFNYGVTMHQYDVATMSCVREMSQSSGGSFAISPCSRVVVVVQRDGVIATRHLYPHNSE